MVKIIKESYFICFELLPFEHLDIENLIFQKKLQLEAINLVS